MASESVATIVFREEDRRHELYLKASSILRVIRAAAFNSVDPADPDAMAHAAWAVEGMLDEIHEIGRKISGAAHTAGEA